MRCRQPAHFLSRLTEAAQTRHCGMASGASSSEGGVSAPVAVTTASSACAVSVAVSCT